MNLKEFDRKYQISRIRPKLTIELPADMIFDWSLPLSAPRVYAALKYLQIGSMPIRASHLELTNLTGLTKHTIVKALKKLKENGFLEIEFRSGDVNIYQFPPKQLKTKKDLA